MLRLDLSPRGGKGLTGLGYFGIVACFHRCNGFPLTLRQLRRIDEGLDVLNCTRKDLGFQKRPIDDPFRLPRLRVLGGTSPAALLELIRGARRAPDAPPAY